MPRIEFRDEAISGDFPEDSRLLDCANSLGIRISQVCGGDGACGTCRVEVLEAWDALSPQTPDEIYKELEPPYRLSCQSKLRGDVVVRVARIE